MSRLIKRSAKPFVFSVRDYYERRNKVLILRANGGLGDILMHRMLFEDIKILNSELEITFACPAAYNDAVYDHPFLDKVIDCKKVDVKDYIFSGITTNACNIHEMAMAPYSKHHRSDIWARHCGMELTKHNMHINLEEEYIASAKKRLQQESHGKKSVVLCPISAMIAKNLTNEQQIDIINILHELDYHVYVLHNKPMPHLTEIGIPVWNNLSIREWMGAIEVSDYVISVDSAAFHYAGGVGKPLLGIYTFADGKVYGKYYQSELIQIHRDTHKGWCGPCYNWPNCPKTRQIPKPCLTNLTIEDFRDGIQRMLSRW